MSQWEVIRRRKAQHRAQDLMAFLRKVEASGEPGLDILVLLDYLSPHRAPPVQRWLERHPRVQFRLTPSHASSPGLVERFLVLLTQRR